MLEVYIPCHSEGVSSVLCLQNQVNWWGDAFGVSWMWLSSWTQNYGCLSSRESTEVGPWKWDRSLDRNSNVQHVMRLKKEQKSACEILYLEDGVGRKLVHFWLNGRSCVTIEILGAQKEDFKEIFMLRVIYMHHLCLHDPENECFLKFCTLHTFFCLTLVLILSWK